MQDERSQPVGHWPDDDEENARDRAREGELPPHEIDPSDQGARPGEGGQPDFDEASPLVIRGPTG
jgi:hypothetical protein